ncbi:hypothetical protein FNL37_2223 [Methylovorus glucosotrophus]|jgi:hypothetical protein|uniref:Uncharacterized protein n=1 Tax=Methylovorus glucosotrophus (strain SIP3-4) TaxID=582744 RepID=C6X9S2_METGS|nr:hypothetical protein Msip34_0644 [Methylovorus glucosotrophus SIP3-4]KAF0844768.1 hypothetical protein FNL37_2223 [Methylovorus glucosotrophus]
MESRVAAKYVYQIRSRNGVVVDNLQIFGRDETEARLKLQKMYTHCEILDCRVLSGGKAPTSNYEDILDLLVKST